MAKYKCKTIFNILNKNVYSGDKIQKKNGPKWTHACLQSDLYDRHCQRVQ